MPHHHSPASHDQDTVTSIDVERALKGLTYPATKEQLVAYAEGQQADHAVVNRIRTLPGDHYDNVADVATAFSRSQSQGKHKGM